MSSRKYKTVLGVISDLYIEDEEVSYQVERGLELIPGKLVLRFLTNDDQEVYGQRKLIEKRKTYGDRVPVFELKDAVENELFRDPLNVMDLAILADCLRFFIISCLSASAGSSSTTPNLEPYV